MSRIAACQLPALLPFHLRPDGSGSWLRPLGRGRPWDAAMNPEEGSSHLDKQARTECI